MQDEQNINRVLLSDINIYNEKYLITRLNDLISMGACKIGIIDTEHNDKVVSCLNPKLQDKIFIVDKDKTYHELVKSFIEPIADNYKIEIPNVGEIMYDKNLPYNTASALSSLCFNFYKFIIGNQYKLQIDIDLDHFLKSIEHMKYQFEREKEYSNILDFKTELAMLSNIIKSYEKIETNRIKFISTAKEEQIEIYDELVSNKLYQNISSCSLKTGEVGKNKDALRAFNINKKLLFQGKLKKIFKNADISITLNLIFLKMSIKFKTINFNERYLSPIVNLKS